MIIEALNSKFEVIHIRQVREEYRILYCRTEKQEEYTILHFREGRLVRTLLPYFDSLKSNTAYEDYKGCFSKEEELYVVFCKRTGISVAKFLSAHGETLERRILIGKRVLEKILLWKLPDFMIVQLLDAERILLKGEDVYFAYDWNILLNGHSDMAAINQRMAQFLRVLFKEEIGNAVSLRLMELLEHLEQDMPEDFFAIYEEYSVLYDVMPQEAEEYVSGIRKIKKKAKENALKLAGYGKIVLFAAAYIAAVWLLLSQIQAKNVKEQETEGIIFEAIGNLKIE